MTEPTKQAARLTPKPRIIKVGGYPPVRIVSVWTHAEFGCASWKDERTNSIPGEPCFSTECGYTAHVEVQAGTDWSGSETWQEPLFDDVRWRSIALELVEYIARANWDYNA